MSNTLKINANGAVVYWRSKDGSRQRLVDELKSAGFESFAPGPRGESPALKAAIKAFCESNRTRGCEKLILAHRDQDVNGFEVRNVRREETVNDLTFDFAVAVRFGQVELTAGVLGELELNALQNRYLAAKDEVTAAEVGGVMVRIVEHLGGVILRPQGGVYWLPDQALEGFRRAGQAVETATSSSVYQVHTVIDSDTIRAVKDAIVDEVTEAAVRVRQELKDNPTGKTAAKNRAKYAEELRARVCLYEGILGEALDALHEIIGLAETEAQMAQAIVADNETFQGIF